MVLDFRVDLEEEAVVPILRVNGEIDIYTFPKLSKAMKDLIDKGTIRLILNLENVQYIDSTGLGAIAHSSHVIAKQGGKVSVVCTRPQVRKIFDVSGLSKKNIDIFEEESEALKHI